MPPDAPLARVPRREFLKGVGALAGAATLGQAAELGSSRPPSSTASPSPPTPFPIREATVRDHRGAPTLHLNGVPHHGLSLFFGIVVGGAEDIRNFAGAGIDGFSGVFELASHLREDGTLDLSEVQRKFDYVLQANPRALILPRLGIDRTTAPEWWRRKFGDELQVNLRPATGERISHRFSYSSRVWRQVIDRALAEYIRWCEQRYGDNIVGYHLGAGEFGEWSYSWDPTVISDYSAPQREGFRRWLRARYRNDVRALRTAWHADAIDFDQVEIPRDRLKGPNHECLFDPARDRASIDYLEFHSQTLAEAAVHFCAAAKQTLAELGRRKLVGIFYGYHFKNFNRPANFHNTGHFAQDIVLASPAIDFVAAPYLYTGREGGNLYQAQLLAGTLRLHGKLYYCEEDTFTFLAKEIPLRFPCPDRDTTIHVFRRNLMGILRDGGTAWYMDCGANGADAWKDHGIGWYRDPGLMENFRQMAVVAERRLHEPSLTPTAQIAVILSDESTRYLRQDAALVDSLIFKQTLELGAIGAPFDTYRVEDLERLFAQPWARQYRLFVFLDAVYMSARTREAIARHVARADRTVLWMYAAGLLTDDGISPAAMEEVTGIRVAVRAVGHSLLGNVFRLGGRLLHGSEQLVNPMLDAPEAAGEVQGWFLNTGTPSLVQRRLPGWTSIWSGAPALPNAVLRDIARAAGVHIYVEAGEQVIAEGRFLTVHTASAGPREVRLPRNHDVTDLFTGERLVAQTDRIRFTAERARTYVWHLT